MNTELSFLCDSALEDRGKLHALGIGIDSVSGNALPMTHARFVVVCILRHSTLEAGQKRLDVRLLDPDAQDAMPPIQRAVAFTSPDGVVDSRARIIVEVNGVTFRKHGPHAFHVAIDGNEMARLPVNVSSRAGR